MPVKLTLVRASCAFMLLAAAGAPAQDYPTRPVRVLVPTLGILLALGLPFKLFPWS